MIFPRREDATNKDLVLTIIEIQGYLSRHGKSHTNWHETLNEVIARLKKEPSRDMEEIKEIMECAVDAETKCKMISNILTAKSHYFENREPKTDVLDKIRAEIEEHAYPVRYGCNSIENGMTLTGINQVIDKYRREAEE